MIENHGDQKEDDCYGEPPESEIHKTDECHTAPNQYYKYTNQPGWKGWLRNPEYVFSACVAVFTLILTLTSVGQWSVMRGQLAEMSKEQRPWILKATHKDLPVVRVGEKIMWDFYFENYGKTPAINVIQKGKVLFGKDSLKKIRDNYFGEIRTSQWPGSVLGPNFPHYRTAISDEIVHESDIASIHGDGGIVLIYRIEYLDVAGNEYFTEVCQYMLASGAVANCGPHNRIK